MGTALVVRDISPVGRPPNRSYTPELGEQICALIREGRTITQIGNMPGMPSRGSIVSWTYEHEDFSINFHRAREICAEVMVDETIGIADDGSRDYRVVDTETGPRVVVDHDHIKRTAIRIGTRQWWAAKIAATRYGDKSQVELTAKNGAALGAAQAAQIARDPVALQRAYQAMIKGGTVEE